MDIIRITYPFAEEANAVRQVLAIGYFDGVHTGHQEVLRKTAAMAHAEGIFASVMTFDPHPREVLGGVHHPQYITPLNEKLAQFAACGMDRCYILTFNKTLSALTPEQFVQEVLFPLRVETAVVGFNFTFGHLGRGTVEQMRELGGDRMKVHVVRPFLLDGFKVSSTLIRENLHAGRLDIVTELLGRPYSITGLVVHGLGRGQTIGIPTANVQPNDPYVIPVGGVYAVKVHIGEHHYGGVMNVGIKPTFENDPKAKTLEVHIFDFNRSIYGESVKVDFIGYIREERKFNSVDELIVQIRADMAKAKTILSFPLKVDDNSNRSL